MLHSHPTNSGVGLAILGNYADLSALYTTVHHVSNTLSESNIHQKGASQLLMNFAYEIRKAYSGHRLIEKVTFEGDDIEHTHYGFQLVWPDIMVFISALRHSAGYAQTDRLQQATMYMLEYTVERSLFEYDAEGAAQLQDYIAQRINVTCEHSFLIYQILHRDFVLMKAGKARFRKLPQMLGSYFSEWSPDYKRTISDFQYAATNQACQIGDLEVRDFPEIKW